MKFTYTLMEIFWLSIKRYKSQRKLKRERERERERSAAVTIYGEGPQSPINKC